MRKGPVNCRRRRQGCEKDRLTAGEGGTVAKRAGYLPPKAARPVNLTVPEGAGIEKGQLTASKDVLVLKTTPVN